MGSGGCGWVWCLWWLGWLEGCAEKVRQTDWPQVDQGLPWVFVEWGQSGCPAAESDVVAHHHKAEGGRGARSGHF